MPHVTIYTVPGHSEEVKQSLSEKIRRTVSQEFDVEEGVISVSVEEVEKTDWRPFIRTVNPESFYIEPSYLPEYQDNNK
ncbi:tautomerase family protein [Eubacterium callanderi]|uniref:Tautomerase family protein n=1 Tax=Eubacterium callanderi TaxID=53442 RepID=A0A853JKU0_9FIRM|nr:tautomerase family protein [Eubacterium callanderi]